MKNALATIALAAGIALAAPASTAALLSLSSLYAFGDSLSDGGNFPLKGLGDFPPAPYDGSRYSNGPVAVEYLWSHYNPGNPGGFTPSNFGGTNYALGGATTGTGNYNFVNPNVPGFLQPVFAAAGGMQDQIAQFAASCTACFDPSTSLFVVWGFPNDVFLNQALGSPLDGGTLIAAGVQNITNAIMTLAAEGAQHILVPNMPNLGATPGVSGAPPAVVAGLTALTQGFNAVLAGTLTSLDAALGAEIVQYDTYGLFQSVLGNPGAYGFTNVTDACVEHLLDGTCNPATWLFWDSVHPTTAGHSFIGEGFAAAVPLPATSLLLGVGLLGLFGRRATRR